MIGRRGERGSGISVLAARHDDDDMIATMSNFRYDHVISCKRIIMSYTCMSSDRTKQSVCG